MIEGEICCIECNFFAAPPIGELHAGPNHTFTIKPRECQHSNCFKDVVYKSPVYGTSTSPDERVANYEDLNKNNDCFRFEQKEVEDEV
jgi:hypothetical protein